VGYSKIVRDITERKRAEEALAKAKDKLEIRVKERTAELFSANDQLKYYLAEVIRAQEKERKRVARELHDDMAPSLAYLGLELDAITTKYPVLPEEILQRLKAVREKMNGTQQDIRRYSHELHPAILDNLGLEPALETLVAELNSKERIEIKFEVPGTERVLPDEVKLALYRITQEALNNVWKHSKATEAEVSLDYTPDDIRLSIADNGIGFDSSTQTRHGLGLTGMKERAILVGAKLKIESKPGKGTKVIAEVKL
jgi:signal transduction histidine kinase